MSKMTTIGVTLSEVRKFLPLDDPLKQEFAQKKSEWEKEWLPEAQMLSKRCNDLIKRLVVAGILGTGAIFLLLAAYEVVPNGLIVISKLEPCSRIVGYALAAVSVASIFLPVRNVYTAASTLKEKKQGFKKIFEQTMQELTANSIQRQLNDDEILQVDSDPQELFPKRAAYVKNGSYSFFAPQFEEWIKGVPAFAGNQAEGEILKGKRVVQLDCLNTRWMLQAQKKGVGTVAKFFEKESAHLFGSSLDRIFQVKEKFLSKKIRILYNLLIKDSYN